jgi:hypothetical protein
MLGVWQFYIIFVKRWLLFWLDTLRLLCHFFKKCVKVDTRVIKITKKAVWVSVLTP